MKTFRRRSAVATAFLAIGIAGFSSPCAAAQQAALAQKTFVSPEEAVKALRAAVEIDDKAALRNIFGPEFHELLTGDEAQDKANSHQLAKALDEGAKSVFEGDDRVVVEIGRDKWPFPIPLVRADSVWRFDTDAGKEELVNRHIGKDELHAIGLCRAYEQAQKQYAVAERASSGTAKYARKLKSAPGRMDGLYWKTGPNQAPSPFGPKAAEAGVDEAAGTPPKPFHGYFFKILTRQGAAAPGGRMDYVKDGSLTGGFALAAYPEHWGRSGIMTFIVNQDGKLYQRDLGEKTVSIAAAMAEYDPAADWTPVQDQGVMEK